MMLQPQKHLSLGNTDLIIESINDVSEENSEQVIGQLLEDGFFLSNESMSALLNQGQYFYEDQVVEVLINNPHTHSDDYVSSTINTTTFSEDNIDLIRQTNTGSQEIAFVELKLHILNALQESIVRHVVDTEWKKISPDYAVISEWLQKIEIHNHIFTTAYFIFRIYGLEEANAMLADTRFNISEDHQAAFNLICDSALKLRLNEPLTEIEEEKLIELGRKTKNTLGGLARSLARGYGIEDDFEQAYESELITIQFKLNVENRESIEYNTTIQVFPNPFAKDVSILNVSSNEIIAYSITDINQQVVSEGVLDTGINTITLQNLLNQGIYILQLRNKNNLVLRTEKLVKI